MVLLRGVFTCGTGDVLIGSFIVEAGLCPIWSLVIGGDFALADELGQVCRLLEVNTSLKSELFQL